MEFWRCELTYRERFSLAWQLTWPAVAMDVAWSFVMHVMLEVKSQGAEVLYLIPYLLILAPWLVRRMFRKQYEGFRLITLADSGETPMGYTESFKVMWLLSWRTSILMLALLVLVSIPGQLLHFQLSSLVPSTEQAPFLNTVGLSVFENAAALVLMPLVMPQMFSKQYQGFRVMAERVKAASKRGAAGKGR